MKDFSLENRRYVIGGVAVAIVVVYIIRLFTLQLMSDDYKKNADSNAFLKKIEYPSRGIIKDRNGKLLVYNQPAYDIMVVMNEEKGRLDTMEFCQTLGITKEFFIKRMDEIKDRTKNPKDVHWLERAMQSKVERIVTIAYLSLVKIDRALNRGLDDYQACWVTLQDIGDLAFDHNLIIKEAMAYIRQYIDANPAALFDLLPRKFTASQLRTLYELVYGKAVDVRNFHKKIALMEYVIPLEERQQGVAHRAARFYRFDKKIYNKTRR